MASYDGDLVGTSSTSTALLQLAKVAVFADQTWASSGSRNNRYGWYRERFRPGEPNSVNPGAQAAGFLHHVPVAHALLELSLTAYLLDTEHG
jgi:hypothetical protein